MILHRMYINTAPYTIKKCNCRPMYVCYGKECDEELAFCCRSGSDDVWKRYHYAQCIPYDTNRALLVVRWSKVLGKGGLEPIWVYQWQTGQSGQSGQDGYQTYNLNLSDGLLKFILFA